MALPIVSASFWLQADALLRLHMQMGTVKHQASTRSTPNELTHSLLNGCEAPATPMLLSRLATPAIPSPHQLD